MTTHKTSSGVGLGQSNKAEDVAFIQMALKVIPKGKFNKPKGAYWPNRIDGKHSYKINAAISRFKDEHFSEKELKERSLLSESIEAIPSANSKAYKRLVSVLPAKYKGVGYRFGTLPTRIFVYQFKQGNSNARVAFTEQQLAIADADGTKLIQHLKTMIKGFHIIPTIEKSIVGNQGNYQFVIGLKGGQLIDESSGEIRPVTTPSLKKTILSYMQGKLNNPIFPPGSIWEAIGADRLIIQSKKKYQLIASPKTRTWFKLKLGQHKIPFQAAAVQKALDAFDYQRLTGGLTPEKEKFLIEFLGADWPKIQEAYGLRKTKGKEFGQKLRAAVKKRDRVCKQLINAENELRANLKMSPINTLGEFAQDFTALMINRISGPGGKAVSKALGPQAVHTIFTAAGKKVNIAGELVEFAVGFAATGTAVYVDLPQDKVDRILMYLGYAALAVALVGLVLLTGGAGAAAFGAVLLSSSVVTDRALKLAESFKTAYNLAHNVLSNAEFARERLYLENRIEPLTNELKNAMVDIRALSNALGSDPSFDVVDMIENKTELKTAQAAALEAFETGGKNLVCGADT